MAAPSKVWTDIANSRIDVDSPGNTDLFTFIRDDLIHTDERVGIPVAPANRQTNHRHRGLNVDGSDFVELTPQENLISGGDGAPGSGTNAFTNSTLGVGIGNITFQDGSPETPRRIERSSSALNTGAISKVLLSPIQKIKSSSGKGRFTCSFFMKREASASGVVGGTLRFGLHNGSAFLTGAVVDIDFDDVTTEYKRFFFVSDQIVRPTALRVRLEWVANPSDWDTVSNDDVIGHVGGVMVNNGPGLAKWDISHLDGGADDYLSSPTDDIIYWWDEVITVVEKSV